MLIFSLFIVEGGSEHVVVIQNSTSTSESPVLPLEHEIPESLLVHNDVTSPDKTQEQQQQQLQTEKGNEKETQEKVCEDDHKSFEEVQEVDKTTSVPEKGEQNENTEEAEDKTTSVPEKGEQNENTEEAEEEDKEKGEQNENTEEAEKDKEKVEQNEITEEAEEEDKEKGGQTSSPVRTIEEPKDKSETQNYARKSLRFTKPLVSTEDCMVDHGKVKTRNTLKSKKELEKELKSKSVKTLKEISRRVRCPGKQVRPVVNVEVSPRRPRRTSQLPARLAGSEVFIKRKRTSYSRGENSTEAKKVKSENEKEVAEKSDDNEKEVKENSSMTGDSSQESEKPTSSTDSSPTKLPKKRKSNKEKSQGTETADNSENEKPKSKSAKTLPCPVCKQLMREWENVFDHVKKQHSNHPEHEAHLTDLKVRFFCILIQYFLCLFLFIQFHFDQKH